MRSVCRTPYTRALRYGYDMFECERIRLRSKRLEENERSVRETHWERKIDRERERVESYSECVSLVLTAATRERQYGSGNKRKRFQCVRLHSATSQTVVANQSAESGRTLDERSLSLSCVDSSSVRFYLATKTTEEALNITFCVSSTSCKFLLGYIVYIWYIRFASSTFLSFSKGLLFIHVFVENWPQNGKTQQSEYLQNYVELSENSVEFVTFVQHKKYFELNFRSYSTYIAWFLFRIS